MRNHRTNDVNDGEAKRLLAIKNQTCKKYAQYLPILRSSFKAELLDNTVRKKIIIIFKKFTLVIL